eukprot:CAMPEP_0195511048 /NCGR_PEP_ID=MMETSP0794_2-20130614/3502_1 /TAXON_ID=515487 /ORGANISM="Stephanopyxis turris, Strain CCMP 815" /LENGTH=294 /DNA_ID=CAMNT_0040638585 /DNA_START=112 /DNA_END=996 /DNA_ORIENTATION=+
MKDLAKEKIQTFNDHQPTTSSPVIHCFPSCLSSEELDNSFVNDLEDSDCLDYSTADDDDLIKEQESGKGHDMPVLHRHHEVIQPKTNHKLQPTNHPMRYKHKEYPRNELNEHRTIIMAEIVTHLHRQMKTRSRLDCYRRHFQMVVQLESYLFKKSTSFENYFDKSTLRHRLQQSAEKLLAEHQLVKKKKKRTFLESAVTNYRKRVVELIINHLQQKTKIASKSEFLHKYPYMAIKLERHLFRNSPSFQVYRDEKTLPQRLSQIAEVLSSKDLYLPEKHRISSDDEKYQALSITD